MTTIKHASTTILLLFCMLNGIAQADTALHNVNGFTSTDDGILTFSVLLFDERLPLVGRLLRIRATFPSLSSFRNRDD